MISEAHRRRGRPRRATGTGSAGEDAQSRAVHATLRRTGVISSLLGAATVLALAVASQAGAGNAAIPFSASFSGALAFTDQTTVALKGGGQATHMGLMSNEGLVSIAGPPNAAGCIPNVNIETLTAANGDQLVIRSDDVACPIGPTTFDGAGSWVVVGGTGRFADATGGGSLDGVSSWGPDFSPGTFQIRLVGSLYWS